MKCLFSYTSPNKEVTLLEKIGQRFRDETKTSQKLSVVTIVTKFLGRPCRGTGSRVEGRHFIKLWYEGVYLYGMINYYVERDSDSSGSIFSGRCVFKKTKTIYVPLMKKLICTSI